MKRQSERGIRMALSPCGNEEMGRPGQTVGDARPPGSQEPSPGRPASSLTSEDPGTPARPLMFKCGRSLGNERTRNSIQMHEDGNLLYKVRLLQTEKARSPAGADALRTRAGRVPGHGGVGAAVSEIRTGPGVGGHATSLATCFHTTTRRRVFDHEYKEAKIL